MANLGRILTLNLPRNANGSYYQDANQVISEGLRSTWMNVRTGSKHQPPRQPSSSLTIPLRPTLTHATSLVQGLLDMSEHKVHVTLLVGSCDHKKHKLELVNLVGNEIYGKDVLTNKFDDIYGDKTITLVLWNEVYC